MPPAPGAWLKVGQVLPSLGSSAEQTPCADSERQEQGGEGLGASRGDPTVAGWLQELSPLAGFPAHTHENPQLRCWTPPLIITPNNNY